MNILVTGGTGFLGANISVDLAHRNHKVVTYNRKPKDIFRDMNDKLNVIQGDVTNLEHLKKITKNYSIETIVHTAVSTPLEGEAKKDPYNAQRINVQGTVAILEIARLMDLRVVYISSSVVYNPRQDLSVLHENDHVSTAGEIYGSTKFQSETLMNVFNEVYGLDTCSVRCGRVYGPYDPYRVNIAAVMIEKSLKNEAVILSSGSDHPLEFTYSIDLGKGVSLITEAKSRKHQVYNVAGGELWTVGQLANFVEKNIPGSNIKIGSGQLVGQSIRGPSDLTRVKEEFGYKPTCTFEESLVKYADWLRKYIVDA